MNRDCALGGREHSLLSLYSLGEEALAFQLCRWDEQHDSERKGSGSKVLEIASSFDFPVPGQEPLFCCLVKGCPSILVFPHAFPLSSLWG